MCCCFSAAPPPPNPSSALPYQITVKWTPPSDDGGDTVTSYNVKWNTNADMMYPGLTPDKGAVAVLATDASSYTIQDLTAGQRYYGTCSYAGPHPLDCRHCRASACISHSHIHGLGYPFLRGWAVYSLQ